MKGTRPRGRCPECGKDRALTPSGTVWGHSRWEGGHYQDCGRDARPMTAEQCARWDEAELARQLAASAAYREKELAWRRAAQQEAQQKLAETRRAFRGFDEDSFAACPWKSQRVAFIAIAADGPVTFTIHPDAKCHLLRSEYEVLVAWPGEWSQHIFLLSDQDKLAVLAALGE